MEDSKEEKVDQFVTSNVAFMSLRMAKSLTEEMASEIARVAQKRVVEVERVSFACGEVTLKMVKTTLGIGWLLNKNVLFSSDDHPLVAAAFYSNIKATAKPEAYHFNVRFGGTDTIVWRVHFNNVESEMRKPLVELAKLLKQPPVLVDE